MFVSKCQYGLGAMMYHVKPIYVMTHQYINISWHPYLVRMQPHTWSLVCCVAQEVVASFPRSLECGWYI